MTILPLPPGSPELNKLDRLERFLLQDPGNPLLLAETAEAALAAGAFERADQLIETGLGRAADSRPWRFRQASLRIAQRRLDEAHALLSALQLENSTQPSIAHNLAYVDFLRSDYQACVEILEPWMGSPLASAADDVALQVLWLRALHQADRLDEAWEWTQKRLSAGALCGAAAGVASLIALDLSHMDAAQRLSEKALAEQGSHMEALVARASVALSQQDAPRARGLLESALKLNVKDGRAWLTLAFVEMLEMRLSEARNTFEKALTLMPDHMGTWHGLGWACVLQKDLAAAAKAFDAALELELDDGESHGARAVVYALQGEYERAREHVARALALDKSNLAARYAQAILSGEARDLQGIERLSRRLLSGSSRRRR